MLNFQFYEKVKVLYGNGCINQMGELAKELGRSKALIVADPGIMQTDIVDRIKAGLDNEKIGYAVFTDNEPNPPIKASEAAYEMLVAEGCDFIIGVGGGSNMDCAKGANILKHNPAPLIQYANFAKPFNVGDGLIMVPTTAGTGSEMSDGAILSDENHIKFNFIAFMAEKTIDEIAEFLPQAVEDGKNMTARGKMAVAAAVGGYLLVYGHTCAGHSIGQTIGGYFNIPHGTACAYALPWVLEFNAPAVPEIVKRVGTGLGVEFSGNETPEQIGTMVRDAFIEFRDVKCKLPSIKTFDYDEAKFDEIAQVCADEFFQQFNPRTMTKDDCMAVLKNMYA